MKRLTHSIRFLILVSFLMVVQALFSQMVTVNLNVVPPYSPYFKDYAGFGDNKVIVTLNYVGVPGSAPLNVYLAASITSDDGAIKIGVKDTYRASTPISLMPNVPRTITGAQLRDVFANGTPADLILQGISKEDLIMNQALPEGSYNLCITVKNFQTHVMLAQDCRNLFMAHAEPPQLTPFINNEVQAQIPQYVNLSWTPVTPFVQGTTYRLRLIKLLEGINPFDALNYSTQVVLEKSNLRITNFPLDLSSGVNLEEGAMYAAQIIATAPNAFIKNNGKSEPIIFKYKAKPVIDGGLPITTAKFQFFTPRELKKSDTLQVNNENDLLLNWGWVKDVGKLSDLADKEQIEALGLLGYRLSIQETSKNKPLLTKNLARNNQTQMIPGFVQLTGEEADAAGFEDGKSYVVTIEMMDAQNRLYKAYKSNKFVYKRLEDDEERINIRLNGVLKYAFKGFPEIYPVRDTEVTIETYMKDKVSSNPVQKQMTVYNFGGTNLRKIASHTFTTNGDGLLLDTIALNKKLMQGDSIKFKLTFGNDYYVDKHFEMVSLPVPTSNNTTNSNLMEVDFGQLIAKTFGYTLKLQVNKRFGTYKMTKDKDGATVELTDDANDPLIGLNVVSDLDKDTETYEFSVQGAEAVAGIPVVLYRENKKKRIPFHEGIISSTDAPENNDTDNFTIVGVGVTQREGNKSYVVFEKLLATDYEDEGYKILAINNLDEWLKDKTPPTTSSGSTSNYSIGSNIGNMASGALLNRFSNGSATQLDNKALSGVIADIIFYNGSGKTNFIDSNMFVAQVKPFRLGKVRNLASENDYYRTVNSTYEIVSAKPPTSVFRGRLTYAWVSDKNVKRPLANTRFRVMVDYVDGNNRSVGHVRVNDFSGGPLSYSNVSFHPENGDVGSAITLTDQYSTMGEGTTDGNGNFTIEIVNYNEKGNLGSGVLSYTSSTSSTPEAGNTIQDEIINRGTGASVINPSDFYNMAGGMGMYGDNFSNGASAAQSSVSNNQRTGIQSNINGNSGVNFNAATGAFELGSALKGGAAKGAAASGKAKIVGYNSYEPSDFQMMSGPNPSPDPAPLINTQSSNNDIEMTQFKRVLRIVVDGDERERYYPSKDVIEIQPFENNMTPKEITAYVREVQLNVETKELTKDGSGNNISVPLSGMQITVFRDIESRKRKRLPQGEGDGKYKFAELINPEYNMAAGAQSNQDGMQGFSVFNQKFEHLWSAISGNSQGKHMLRKLLQDQLSTYYIEASSFVDQPGKAFQATIVDAPRETFDITSIDWSNPSIPVIERVVELKPLLSRALITIRDEKSGKPITSDYAGRVIVRDTYNNMPSSKQKVFYVDPYGKAEIRVSSASFNSWWTGIAQENIKDFYFFASANGYKTSTETNKFAANRMGTQFVKDISLSPGARITGTAYQLFATSGSSGTAQPVPAPQNVRTGNLGSSTPTIGSKPNVSSGTTTVGNNMNVNTNMNIRRGIPVYLQVDSGKVFESNADGYFDISVPLVTNSKLRIIPKDVGFFEDTILISAAESQKTLLELGDVEVLRRKHRIQLKILQKGVIAVGSPAKLQGAEVQLGDLKRVTDADGFARFEFENVSVNNYTLVVRGPEDGSFIPKTINIHSEESKAFVTKDITLESGSEVTGIVHLDGNPVKNAKVYIDVNNAYNAETYDVSLANNSDSGKGAGGISLSGAAALAGLRSGTTVSGTSQSTSQNNVSQTIGNAGATIASGKIDDDANLIVAYTDNQGRYRLKGIAVNNQRVRIRATLDTTYTVAGDVQNVSISRNQGTADFNLKSYRDIVLNEVFGFPFSVEEIEESGQNKLLITGLIHWEESMSDFKLNEVNKAVRIAKTEFNVRTVNGVKVASPATDVVSLSGINSLRLTLLDKFNVKLSKEPASGSGVSSLSLIKNDDRGKISGKVQIVDNSFNFPNTYLSFEESEFYLAKVSGTTVNNTIDVFSSAMSVSESNRPDYLKRDDFMKDVLNVRSKYKANEANYHLSDANAGAVKFKLIRFNAEANPLKSYIDQDGKIHLNTNVSCYIQGSEPENFTFNIPDMVLDNNKVYPAQSSEALTLNLEDWKLEIKDWVFSVEEGGILSTNGLIRTKLLDVPVEKFVLRSDMFLMDTKLDNLTLAGGKFRLNLDRNIKPNLNYEHKIGSDMKPHWNLNLISTGGNKVGSLEGLEGLYANSSTRYIVDFDYIQILSNNEMLVQLKQKQEKAYLMKNGLAQYEPISITSGTDYITINGVLHLGAPRMSGILLNANWSSPNSNPQFDNVSLDFEGKGSVHFVATNQEIVITKDVVSIKGRVEMQPVKAFNPIPATFYARTNRSPRYEVGLQKDWETLLTEDESANSDGRPMGARASNPTAGYKFKVDLGGMKVDMPGLGDVNIDSPNFGSMNLGSMDVGLPNMGNMNIDGPNWGGMNANLPDWGNLSFSGIMMPAIDFNPNLNMPDYDIGQLLATFDVLGAIKVYTPDLKLSTFDFGFGKMDQIFDFPKKRLLGTLNIENPVQMGLMRLKGGVIETNFDLDGFYVAGGAKAFIPAGFLSGDYNVGFMLGSYPMKTPQGMRMWDITNSYIDKAVVDHCYYEKTNRLGGVYTAFNREILNVDVDYNFVIASGYVRALALMGGNFYFNYDRGWKLGGSGYAYFDVKAGLWAITGTSIDGRLKGNGRVDFSVGNTPQAGRFDATLDLSFRARLTQSLLVGSISKSMSVDCHASAGTSGFDFSLEKRGKQLGGCD